MTIAWAVIREKLRRKDLYIVSAIGIAFILLFSTSGTSVTYNGQSMTAYAQFTPIMHTVLWVIAGALTIATSISTIPNEYRRGTSHLVWVRGVSQPRYHSGLILGNLISSLAALGLLYIGFAMFIVIKGHGADLIRLPVSCLLTFVPVALLCVFSSVVSIKLPGLTTGLVSIFLLVAGTARSLLDTLANALVGFVGGALRVVVAVIPDLYSQQAQGTNFLLGNKPDAHSIFVGLLVIYALFHLILILRKGEA